MKSEELHRLSSLLNVIPDNGLYVSSVEILQRLATTYGGEKAHQSKLKQISRDLETICKQHPELELMKDGPRKPIKARWPINERPAAFGMPSKGSKRLFKKTSLNREQLIALIYLQKLSRHSLPKRIKRFTSGLLEDIIEHSVEEVRALVPNSSKQETRNLANKWVSRIHSIPERLEFVEPQVDPDIEAILYDALLSEQGLSIAYKNLKNTISIFPVGIVQQGVRSYLIGFKGQEQFPRTYLLTRILAAQIVPHLGFVPSEFSLEDYLSKGIAHPNKEFFDLSAYGREISLHLRVNKSTQWIKESPLSFDQICTPVNSKDPNGDFFLTSTVKLSENLVWWILSMGRNITVLAPEALRLRVKDDLLLALDNYSEPD